MRKRRSWQWWWAFLFGFLSPAFAVLVLFEIVQLWPSVTAITPTGDTTATAAAAPANPVPLGFGITWRLTADQAFLVLAAMAGLLGALLYTMGIYARRRSSGRFRHQDANWYWVRCIIGAGLSLAVYALLRAGLFVLGGQESEDIPSAYGVVGVGIVVGLFTDRALTKLRQLAGNFFAPGDEEADEAGAAATVVRGYAPKALVQGKEGQLLQFDVSNGGRPLVVQLDSDRLEIQPLPRDPDAYVTQLAPKFVHAATLPVSIDLGGGATWTATVPVEPPVAPAPPP